MVKPVYVIISSSIFKRPYSLGNPLVFITWIVSSDEFADAVREVTPTITCGVNWSRLKYWSRLSIRSIGPPWYSCER